MDFKLTPASGATMRQRKQFKVEHSLVSTARRKGGVLTISTGRNGNGGRSSEPVATMASRFVMPNKMVAPNTMCGHCDDYVANFRGDPDRNCEVAKSTRSRCAREQMRC